MQSLLGTTIVAGVGAAAYSTTFNKDKSINVDGLKSVTATATAISSTVVGNAILGNHIVNDALAARNDEIATRYLDSLSDQELQEYYLAIQKHIETLPDEQLEIYCIEANLIDGENQENAIDKEYKL